MNTPRPLDRREASEYLRERHGIKRSPSYLAKQACQGGGPPYRRVNKSVIYWPSELDAYAAELTSEPAKTSAEHAEKQRQAAA